MYSPVFRAEFAPRTASADRAELVGFNDVLRFMREAYRTILVSAVSMALLGMLFCFFVTPSFTGTAQVLIETDHLQSFFQDTPSRSEMETETGRIESQIEVIKSDRIAEAVIRKERLLGDPEFSASSDPPFYAPVVDAVKSLFKTEQVLSEQDVKTARANLALEKFADRLSVRRIGQSFVAEVTFRSNDAAKSAILTNALLAAYIDADVGAKAESARRGNAWLTERLSELRSQVTESRRALEEFKASGTIQSASERAVKLAELDSVSQSQSRLYDVFLQRLMETAQKVTYPVPDARIIATASKPLGKSFPKAGLIVGFTGLLGAAIGVGIAMVRRSSDHTIRSARHLAAKADCDVLGTLAAKPRKARGDRGPSTPGAAPRLLEALTTPGRTPTAFAADMRAVKVAINIALLSRPMKRIGITSVGHGEGKTTLAANLSALFAVSGSRVLLVDLCVGNRDVGRGLAPQAEVGLAEAIKNPGALSSLVVPHNEVENLFILPVGGASGYASPAEQLAANRHRAEIDAIGEGFDLIVFDCPGLRQSPDTLAIAPLLNAVILVAEFGRTEVDEVGTALARFKQSHTEVLGVVINKVDPKHSES